MPAFIRNENGYDGTILADLKFKSRNRLAAGRRWHVSCPINDMAFADGPF